MRRSSHGVAHVEAFVVPYHWIVGESYEIRLLLSTGDTVDYEIEDAA